MANTVIIHISSEDPVVGEVDELPAAVGPGDLFRHHQESEEQECQNEKNGGRLCLRRSNHGC